jgi:hypothetical protein
MHRRFNRGVLIAIALLLTACGSSDPGLVPVIGAAEDLVPLTGEWSGSYDSRATGRSGSITFHLTEDPKGAHGDVLLVPRRDTTHSPNDRQYEPFGGATVLAIEFVQVASGEITGKIAPYPDPEAFTATLETHFAGHVNGDSIEGTFVTYSDHGVSPVRGTWRVRRRA